jgi:L-asparagine oxygenase
MTSVRIDVVRVVEVSAVERDALHTWSTASPDYCYESEHPAYDQQLRSRLADFPTSLRQLIDDFGSNLGDAKVLYLRGLPVPADLPATPRAPYNKLRMPTGTESIVLALALLVGEVLPVRHADGSERVYNLYPIPQCADTDLNANVMRLDLHTDLAFSDDPCEAFTLYCLRNGRAPQPRTQFCDIRRVWDLLEERDRALLSEASFYTPLSTENGSSAVGASKQILTSWRGRSRYDYSWRLLGATPAHAEALQRLNAAMAAATERFTLTAGDCVLIDNTHVVHGRGKQNPAYDGTDRWIQGSYIRARRERTRGT